jgi:hypothetical protein
MLLLDHVLHAVMPSGFWSLKSTNTPPDQWLLMWLPPHATGPLHWHLSVCSSVRWQWFSVSSGIVQWYRYHARQHWPLIPSLHPSPHPNHTCD